VEKRALRKKYKQLRKELGKDERETRSLSIANQMLTLDIWEKEFYHVFLPIERLLEVNTEYILSILSGKDKNIVISKSNFESMEMDHYLLLDNTKIVVNEYGIPEPDSGIPISLDQIDVVFVPLLAYDNSGNRVGYGKGFYDRFLAKCREDVLTVGLSYFEPEVNEIPIKDIDISIKYTISPKKVWKF